MYAVWSITVFPIENEIGHSFPGRAPVVLYHLRKEYPSPGGGPPYVAVQSVSLAIKKNECFGLLGPNGTCISSSSSSQSVGNSWLVWRGVEGLSRKSDS